MVVNLLLSVSFVFILLFYRPTMLFCILGVIVSFALFGFSQNFVWAVCSRLLWGLLDGIVGISKTYISEVWLCHHIPSFIHMFCRRYVMKQIRLEGLH